MPAVQSLILESGDEAVVNAALPVLLTIAKAQDPGSTSNLVGTGNGIIHCMIAWLALAVEAAGLILVCGVAEPVEPPACGLAVTEFMIAGGEAGHACG